MKTFKDNSNRQWELVVNVKTAKRVREKCGVDLFKLYQEEAERVTSDPCLLVDVLYVLCEDQCRKQGVSDEQFGEALFGDVIDNAVRALYEEVANFFPSSKREILRKQLLKSEQLTAEMTEKAIKVMEEMTLDQLTSTLTSSKSVTKQPESSASTPTPTH